MKRILDYARRFKDGVTSSYRNFIHLDVIYKSVLDKQPMTIFAFDGKESLLNWRLGNDAELGGESTVSLEYDDKEECAVFSGRTVTEQEGVLKRLGFGAMVSRPFPTPKLFEHHNAFELDVNSDGRVYVFNVTPNIVGDTSHIYQCMFRSTPGKWEKVRVPFRSFVSTLYGNVSDVQWEFDRETAVDSIGILMAERKSGPYCLKIRSIDVVSEFKQKRYDPNFNFEEDDLLFEEKKKKAVETKEPT